MKYLKIILISCMFIIQYIHTYADDKSTLYISSLKDESLISKIDSIVCQRDKSIDLIRISVFRNIGNGMVGHDISTWDTDLPEKFFIFLWTLDHPTGQDNGSFLINYNERIYIIPPVMRNIVNTENFIKHIFTFKNNFLINHIVMSSSFGLSYEDGEFMVLEFPHDIYSRTTE